MPEEPVVAEVEKEKHISEVRRKAVQIRWDQVKQDREDWIRPFHDLRIDRALEYHHDLQNIWEEGARILNERIGNEKHIKCSGPTCGKNLSGLKPNGMPKWIAKRDYNDIHHPGVIKSIYFCSELCANEYTKKQGGGAGTTT
jgi:hypothetical protein